MNRRARLDLSAQPAGAAKTAPDLDGRPTTVDAAPASGVGAPGHAVPFRARQVGKALAVVAMGALCIYLLARRR